MRDRFVLSLLFGCLACLVVTSVVNADGKLIFEVVVKYYTNVSRKPIDFIIHSQGESQELVLQQPLLRAHWWKRALINGTCLAIISCV